MYSQNHEEKHILEYFGDFKGSLLDIGANDGVTFSNSLRLIELGWNAHLVEPSPAAFAKLAAFHSMRSNVTLSNIAIGTKAGRMPLHESGAHVRGGSDTALVSSLDKSETDKWRKSGVQFQERTVQVERYEKILGHMKFDFITIDAEGLDIEILKQIDLSPVKLLCIEWNGIQANKDQIMTYCLWYGMKNVVYQSVENLIIGR